MFNKYVYLFILFFTTISAQIPFQTNSNPVKLVGGDGDYFINPKWAPDGGSIAFTGSNYQGLWVMNIGTKNLRKISDELAVGFGFSWSNDASKILTRSAVYEGNRRKNAVQIIDAEDGKETLLTNYRNRMPGLPRWSNDNSEVYFYNGNELEIIRTNLFIKQTVNQKMYYAAKGQISISSVGIQEFNNIRPFENADYINISLSSDGNYFVFEVMGGNMYSMRVDGTELIDLGTGYRPEWSSDSQYIVYMVSEDNGHKYTKSDIYITQKDGQNKINITNTSSTLEMNPSWSPDRSQIAYNDIDTGEIYILELNK